MTPHVRLVADLGGTRARFMLAPVRGDGRRMECAARDHDDIESAVAAALVELDVRPDGIDAAFAVAGPVLDGHAEFTNLGWRADAAQLQARFGFRRVLLLNDVEAGAYAASCGHTAGVTPLHAAAARAGARHALISVGTGLGVAYWRGPADVEASEAGHAGFAPEPGWARDLCDALGDGTRISWERLLSGSGLREIDAFSRGWPLLGARDVATAARVGDEPAVQAVSRFAHLLGLFAGDLVLAAPAPGGVLLAGGVISGLAAVFDDRAFVDGYLRGRRLPALLAAAPASRTNDDDLALRGALAALA